MRLAIDIDCEMGALHDNLLRELEHIFSSVPTKISKQLERDGRCICEALESADDLRDTNGDVVGRLRVRK